MFQSIRRMVSVAAVVVCAVIPQTVFASSKMAVSVQGKVGYTVNAVLNTPPAAGEIGQFDGTIVEPGKLPPSENNFSGGFGRLQGVAFTRLSADTITAVDAKGTKFWIIIKGSGEKASASISDGTDTLAKAEFSGVWFNDTGEAGAQSIALVLTSFFAQQTQAPGEPDKPSLEQCQRLASLTCTWGVASLTWSASGTCNFTCFPRPANPQ